jgi:Cu(I)/Ag(I) efflux system membrane protein CusA/SilA
MWSHSTGAEVMKPLATPVLGGMLSSLALVLIVTPVLFYWLREREIREAERQGTANEKGIEARPAIGPAD